MSLHTWPILVAVVNVGLSVEAPGAGTAESPLAPR